MTIERFECVAVYEEPGYTYAAMKPCETGGYVSYESHAEKMRLLQSELDASKQIQKDDFFYHAKPIMEKCFESALESIRDSLIPKVLKVNPCKDIVGKFVKELEEINRQHIKAEMFMVDPGEHFINEAVIGGAILHNAKLTDLAGSFMARCMFVKPEDIRKAAEEVPISTGLVATAEDTARAAEKSINGHSLKCVKSNCDYFTAGKSYSYGVDGDEYFINQDNYVSDLEGETAWSLEDCGAYLMMRNSHSKGDDAVIFAKPHGLSKRFGK